MASGIVVHQFEARKVIGKEWKGCHCLLLYVLYVRGLLCEVGIEICEPEKERFQLWPIAVLKLKPQPERSCSVVASSEVHRPVRFYLILQ